jgi:hypothetical protein
MVVPGTNSSIVTITLFWNGISAVMKKFPPLSGR